MLNTEPMYKSATPPKLHKDFTARSTKNLTPTPLLKERELEEGIFNLKLSFD
jgi:hypothetical protein